MQSLPAYNKPETPGIHLSFDNTIALYYIIAAEETFEAAAQGMFHLLKEAQSRFPDWPRAFYLDIMGHQVSQGQWEEDFIELQQEFLFSTIAPFVTVLETPLVGAVANPEVQQNCLPDRLRIA